MIVITQHTLAKFSHILYINYHAFVSSDHTGHAQIQGGEALSFKQSLISPILLEMKKLVIFHICALSQLHVKQNQSTKYKITIK